MYICWLVSQDVRMLPVALPILSQLVWKNLHRIELANHGLHSLGLMARSLAGLEPYRRRHQSFKVRCEAVQHHLPNLPPIIPCLTSSDSARCNQQRPHPPQKATDLSNEIWPLCEPPSSLELKGRRFCFGPMLPVLPLWCTAFW